MPEPSSKAKARVLWEGQDHENDTCRVTITSANKLVLEVLRQDSLGQASWQKLGSHCEPEDRIDVFTRTIVFLANPKSKIANPQSPEASDV